MLVHMTQIYASQSSKIIRKRVDAKKLRRVFPAAHTRDRLNFKVRFMGPYYVVTSAVEVCTAVTKIAPQAKVPRNHGST